MSSNENPADGDRIDPSSPSVAGRSPEARRPIDAPSLPPWGLKPRSTADADEDAPTQNDLPSPVAPSPEPVDPRELARRLAAEAKQRVAEEARVRLAERQPILGSDGSPTSSSPPTSSRDSSPPTSSRDSHEEPSMSAEDPRELARRLAEEAKKRLRDVPPPVDEPLDELFDNNHHDDDDASWVPPSADDDGENSPSAMVTKSLAERAIGGTGRPMSALEALAAAREAEKHRSSSPPAAPSRSAARPAAASQETHRSAEPSRAPSAAGPAPLNQIEVIVREHYPGASVDPALPVTNVEVFRALWRAHRARAQHEGDVNLVATAGVLLDAVDRVAAGWLVAAKVSIGSRQHPPEAWAVWVDLERRTVIGVARPAEVYLAGI